MAETRTITAPLDKRFREGTRRRSFSRPPKGLGALSRDQAYWVLAALLVMVFLFGGGSRADIASLMFLRPASVLVLAYALMKLTGEQIRANRFIFGMAAAWIVLLLLHLVPLPPAIWQALPGREVVKEIDEAAGLGGVWRPLTMVPYATRNTLWATMAPLAVLVLGVQLDQRQRAGLLPLILVLGLFSALVAVLQILGDPRGPLYFYRITNSGSAVGLFANRNHQAVFLALLLPMLVVWARTRGMGQGGARRARQWPNWAPMAAGICFLIPLILITGSRSGMIMGLVALLLLPAIFAGTRPVVGDSAGRTETFGKLRMIVWLFPLGVVALAALTILLDRGLAAERLMSSGAVDDMRVRILPTLLSMIRLYAPWGSGIGTFEQIYRLHEPDELLAPIYVNHAHNDWLELALTGGIPALALAAVAVGAFLLRLVQLAVPAADRESLLFARLGLVVVLILALASLSDYPLRVPSLACLAVISALWVHSGKSSVNAED